MATKKDLVEAYSFSRRRLVTAFVSGAPGGREVEPSRPGRTIVGGIALAVLMIAAAAVLGILTDRDPGDWQQVGLVSEKETGANYVILTEKGELRPVVNITSAMLLLGPELTKTDVSREVIARDGRRGEPIGILQAPGTPPAASDLLPTGWTACTGRDMATGDPYGVKVTLTNDPGIVEPTPSTGFVVRSGGRLYVIGESLAETDRDVPRAYAYEIQRKGADAVLSQVVDGANAESALPVPRQWLDLFTPGTPLSLDSFGIEAGQYGGAPGDASDLPDGARVGDLVVVDGSTYLVTPDSGVVELGVFALDVYSNLKKPKGFKVRELEADSRPGEINDTDDLGINWPADTLDEKTAGEYCAQLDAVTDGIPGARLASVLDGEASSAEVAPGSVERFVESGRGAVVEVGDWDLVGESPTALIDDRGFVFSLIGDAGSQLGYGDVDDVVVPDAWVKLFPEGVELSVDAARCPPTTVEREGPCAGS